MYTGYIIECPLMSDLFWEFVSIKYQDEPEELHSMSSSSLNKLNKHMQAINEYLKDLAADEEMVFSDYDDFIGHVLDNYPSDIDGDVLNIYINNIETIVSLVGLNSNSEMVLLDRFGSVAVTQE